MINNEEFSKRLKKVLQYYQLSASAFAEKISVQRSSISHLLSGRNKPSLDFVLKVLSEFKEVELYWLLNGKGSFPKLMNSEKITNSTTPTLFNQELNPPEIKPKQETQFIEHTKQLTNIDSEIERIVIFYKNGKFKEYMN